MLNIDRKLPEDLFVFNTTIPISFPAGKTQTLVFESDKMIKNCNFIFLHNGEKRNQVPDRVSLNIKGKRIEIDLLISAQDDIYYRRGEQMFIMKMLYEENE